MRTKGGGFETLEFHPVHVNSAFGVTSAALGNASEPQQNCLLKPNVKAQLGCITRLEMSCVTSVSRSPPRCLSLAWKPGTFLKPVRVAQWWICGSCTASLNNAEYHLQPSK